MTPAEHKARHIELHKSLDELVADWLLHHVDGPLLGQFSVLELMVWSAQQTQDPTELPE